MEFRLQAAPDNHSVQPRKRGTPNQEPDHFGGSECLAGNACFEILLLLVLVLDFAGDFEDEDEKEDEDECEIWCFRPDTSDRMRMNGRESRN